MSTTDDPTDERLGHGVDNEPVPQQKAYLVLSGEERAKGFVRPLRSIYAHVQCSISPNAQTTMASAIAETYARNPKFYGATYCTTCRQHRPLSEFVWVDLTQTPTTEVVGS